MNAYRHILKSHHCHTNTPALGELNPNGKVTIPGNEKSIGDSLICGKFNEVGNDF